MHASTVDEDPSVWPSRRDDWAVILARAARGDVLVSSLCVRAYCAAGTGVVDGAGVGVVVIVGMGVGCGVVDSSSVRCVAIAAAASRRDLSDTTAPFFGPPEA